MEHSKGKWVNGYNGGVTGPTTPVSEPTVAESVAQYDYKHGHQQTEPEIQHTIVSCNKQTIAIIPTCVDEGEANAQLIALAPAMLQMLEDVTIMCNAAINRTPTSSYREKLTAMNVKRLALINKAKGE